MRPQSAVQRSAYGTNGAMKTIQDNRKSSDTKKVSLVEALADTLRAPSKKSNAIKDKLRNSVQVRTEPHSKVVIVGHPLHD